MIMLEKAMPAEVEVVVSHFWKRSENKGREEAVADTMPLHGH